jgi:hypothetical protein
MRELNKEERRAVDALLATARIWPRSLWLFSADGTLWVMRKKDGQRAVTRTGGMDQDYALDAIPIENDGGDW